MFSITASTVEMLHVMCIFDAVPIGGARELFECLMIPACWCLSPFLCNTVTFHKCLSPVVCGFTLFSLLGRSDLLSTCILSDHRWTAGVIKPLRHTRDWCCLMPVERFPRFPLKISQFCKMLHTEKLFINVVWCCLQQTINYLILQVFSMTIHSICVPNNFFICI